MKLRSVLLFTVCLCLFLCGCRKKKDLYPGSLKGIVVYTSCATTVIRMPDEQLGVAWTNCHSGQSYEHVFDAHPVGTDRVLKAGDVIYFDVVPDERVARCKVWDCVPSMSVSITLR
ncbi:hypothetical protein [Chitinophaga sp. S165]|uniref:hypothetical protein n=1 Tax=Chitinophaga sp. S165 TaxID=2135462 RepID=UPI000D71181C|nr:hypothetical protein [Chitinophaga sp. S165]PWV53345.1 hypothetical protein C7475_10293 [Chitinophaga sp. S165]